MQYSYETSLIGLTTKPLDIYKGTKKIGIIRGHYKNIFQRFADEFFDGRFPPSFIKYELMDIKGNIRFLSETKGFFKSEIEVTYNERW